MLGTQFYPSHIEDEIYGIMDDYIVDSCTYEAGLVEAISDFFMNYKKGEWQLGCAEWPNSEGGSCSVSWIEDGHLHMIGFDYTRKD